MKEKGESFNKVQVNYSKDSYGKSSTMVNIREDDPETAVELYYKTKLLLVQGEKKYNEDFAKLKENNDIK